MLGTLLGYAAAKPMEFRIPLKPDVLCRAIGIYQPVVQENGNLKVDIVYYYGNKIEDQVFGPKKVCAFEFDNKACAINQDPTLNDTISTQLSAFGLHSIENLSLKGPNRRDVILPDGRRCIIKIEKSCDKHYLVGTFYDENCYQLACELAKQRNLPVENLLEDGGRFMARVFPRTAGPNNSSTPTITGASSWDVHEEAVSSRSSSSSSSSSQTLTPTQVADTVLATQAMHTPSSGFVPDPSEREGKEEERR